MDIPNEAGRAPVVVTGAAGFIGAAVAHRLLDRGDQVVGVDDLAPYYDVRLKEARLERLKKREGFAFERLDLVDRAKAAELFRRMAPGPVVHLAAQPGARKSLLEPRACIDGNLVAFGNVLEGCRAAESRHLVFASSSSVYGARSRLPFSEHDCAEHPVSLYAATKKANELMAHAYSQQFGLPVTGLRFFTVYGPWGRPDMAPMLFTSAILEGRPIELFAEGRMRRDFTYVDDVAEGVIRVVDRPARPDPAWSGQRPDPAGSRAPYRLYNVGTGEPVELRRLVELLERLLGRPAFCKLLPVQPGEVTATQADVTALVRDFGFRPTTSIEEGLKRTVAWYRDQYRA